MLSRTRRTSRGGVTDGYAVAAEEAAAAEKAAAAKGTNLGWADIEPSKRGSGNQQRTQEAHPDEPPKK